MAVQKKRKGIYDIDDDPDIFHPDEPLNSKVRLDNLY